MNTPPKLTKEQILSVRDSFCAEPVMLIAMGKAIEAARDAQWLEHVKVVEAQRDELLGALESIQSRIRESAGLPVSDGDVFDSFYQDVIDEAIAKAQASEPAPKREWVGLTTDEMKEVADRYHLKPPNVPAAFRAIEAKLKELNHG